MLPSNLPYYPSYHERREAATGRSLDPRRGDPLAGQFAPASE